EGARRLRDATGPGFGEAVARSSRSRSGLARRTIGVPPDDPIPKAGIPSKHAIWSDCKAPPRRRLELKLEYGQKTGGPLMSDLVVLDFDGTGTADDVLTKLRGMQKEHLIDLEDACVVVHTEEGKVQIKQSVNMAALGAASGATTGMLIGVLAGL